LTSVLSFGLWVADITYVPTWAGFLCLAIVLDGLEPARMPGARAKVATTRLVWPG
jgi:hypothetical protein